MLNPMARSLAHFSKSIQILSFFVHKGFHGSLFSGEILLPKGNCPHIILFTVQTLPRWLSQLALSSQGKWDIYIFRDPNTPF